MRDLAGLDVNQVCPGSCYNSSLQIMMMVAHILKDRKVILAGGLLAYRRESLKRG